MGKLRWGVLCFVLLPVALYAQDASLGGIAGTVHDSSGALVEGAQVVAVNQGTTLRRESTTNSDGGYGFTLLPIGTYTLTVTQKGFTTVERTNVPVISGQSFTVDFQLALGQVSEVVSVTGAVPGVDTTTVNMGTTRTLEELQALPVGIANSGSREAAGFVKTIAGVTQVGYGPDWMQLSRGSINGTPGVFFGYLIDGVDAGTGESETGEDFIAPTPDTIRETRVTQNTDTSIGFNGGVAYELTLKSGTNRPHGSFYYYGENDYLNATNWFATKPSVSRENELGYTVGGPVYIPHLYDGRNKTFFFTSIDVYRESVAGYQIATLPTTAMRGGDFSQALGAQVGSDALGRPVFQNEIYDPNTTRTVTSGQVDASTGLTANASGPIRDPFMFGGNLNVIDPARLSNVSRFFVNGFAAPTSGGVFNNWQGPENPPGGTFKDQFLLKLDHSINDKHRLSFSLEKTVPWFLGGAEGRSAGYSGHSASQYSAGYLLPVISTTVVDDRGSYRMRFNYSFTVSPTQLFNLSLSTTRDPNRKQLQIPATGPEFTGATDAGLTGTGSALTPTQSVEGFSAAQAGQNSTSSSTLNFGPIFGAGQTIDSTRNVVRLGYSMFKTKHQIRVGVDYEQLPFIAGNATNAQGHANFANSDTGLPEFTAGNTGWGFASYMLGAVNNMTVIPKFTSKYTSSGIGLYAQDTWRVTPKLTVNYGLRWDLYVPGQMQGDKISTFSPGASNPGAGGLPGALTFYGVGPGRNGLTSVADYYFKAFGPRVGFAYALGSKSVVRANFGLSYYPLWTKYIGSSGTTIAQVGFTSLANANESASSGLLPAFYWDQGFSVPIPPVPNLNPAQQNGGNPQYLDRTQNRPPMAENIGLEYERELPKQFVVRVSYVGTMAHRLPLNNNSINVLPLSDISLGSLLFADINSPEAVSAGIPVPYAGFTGTVAQALRPYPQYNTISKLSDQWGSSSYNALQLNVQKHFGSLTMLGNYSYSKWWTDGNFVGYLGYGGANSYQHPDLRAQEARQLSNYDRPHIVNLSWVYELPVGRGKRFLGDTHGVAERIVGGWRLAAIQVYSSGTPLAVTGNQSIPGVGNVWVNRNAGVPLRLSSCGNLNPRGSNNRLLNPAAFSEPAPFTFGNAYQVSRNCGSAEEDLSFDKTISVNEHARFHIGMMFNNALNRHYWGGINTGAANPGFGTVANASPARTVQYYGRFEF